MQAEHAAMIVVTTDSPSSALRTVRAARQAYPHVPLVARSRDERHAQELMEAGAHQVIPETLETGLQLSAAVLQQLDLPEVNVTQTIDDERARRVARLKL
jgi:CPA2 family monovalent cation:H+ antiporter-2